MASSLAQKIDQDFLHCGICLEPFKNPRALPCLHSFCEECLTRWAKTNKKDDSTVLTCPNCMRPTPIPAEGIEGFPAHFVVNSLQATLNMEEDKEDPSSKSCDQCEEPDNMAIVYCQDCKHYLCESCHDIHTAWKAMKHHTVLTVEEKLSEKASPSCVDEQTYCNEHDNEETQFYCETCDKLVCEDCIDSKQCCHDHDTVTLQQAADYKLTGLKDQMKKCNEKKEEIQDAIDKIENIEEEISCSADKIRSKLNMRKALYMQKVENVFQTVLSDVDRLNTAHIKKLTDIKYCLNGKKTEIDSIKELGEHLVETGSNSDIVSNCTPDLSCSFQKVIDLEVNEVEENLHQFAPNIPMPVVTCVVGHQWKQRGQVLLYNSPKGIAVTSDEKIVVSNNNNFGAYSRPKSDVIVYSLTGNVLHHFELPKFQCVSITPSDVYVFPSFCSCQLYNNKYQLLNKFETRNKDKEFGSTVEAVTVDKYGCIVLGKTYKYTQLKQAISIYSSDGRDQAHFTTSIVPMSLAVTSKEEIVIANGKDKLQLLNYAGKCLHTIEPPAEVTKWKPRYVCCSTKDDVFVVNQGDPKAIYKYAAGRVYKGCVTTEVNYPWGIALSHNDQYLFVGEGSGVQIFQAP
ncbi:tripartite motif-containing protein 2-like [Amphiura filiformis]|uniref:tripartite motif-containing protein 2-like n=1 Tax=Amphiura filiformis TaxID=82378 RepID=UPI003B2202EF